ncbi:MAG: putative General secretion pathway protein GspG [Candidatus Berkelbacteria bacterium Licking1014_7]|uniref:Putative General secretion pathway protein GspG n=1 Tax=Candidatus Berkelbacteria bacterium Licking1014_7 TaxID=2017147 RepID=A0A554LLC4_9BACT|nr:MAG: putative General secretion pathway protein GspG [Candidatus Berkelbacteria bacterium Licking1014_7]
MFSKKGFTPFRNSRIFLTGFTLIELLVTISIIGILAGIMVVTFQGQAAKARDTARKATLTEVMKALDLYYEKNGTYAVSGGGFKGAGAGWLDLEDNADYTRSVIGKLYDVGLFPAQKLTYFQNTTANNEYMIYDGNGGTGVPDTSGVCLYSFMEKENDTTIDQGLYDSYQMRYKLCKKAININL